MLEIDRLSCGYGKRIVLKDINLKIDRGQFIGVIGPNGCGKTTLIRAITKVIHPKEGRIKLNDRDIGRIKYRELAKEMAVVSQDTVIESMNVEEYVLLGRIPHAKNFQFFESENDIKIAERSMGMTNILELRDRSLAELSGGERQRAHIARALAQEPKVLLLDEPTTHLDIGHQIELLELLKDLNKKGGLTIIIILHDLNLAGCYCDKLVLMNNGGIYKEGGADSVLTYQNIEEVYKTVVVVEKNPVTKKPYIFVAPKT